MNKVTVKEKRLLFLLVVVFILAGSYQFGYVRFHSMTVELEGENLELTNKLLELQQKQSKKQTMKEETKEYLSMTKVMLLRYPKTLTQEKNLLFITELEQYANIKIESISFNETNVFYTGTDIQAGIDIQTGANTQTGADTQTGTDTQEGANLVSDTEEEAITLNGPVTGYQTTLNLNYQSTYEGLKKAIDFINTYNEKRHVTNITAAFDMSTGNLSGTMSIVLYEAEGGTAYEAPELDNIGVGKDNIFGTFEN